MQEANLAEYDMTDTRRDRPAPANAFLIAPIRLYDVRKNLREY